jgi:hypothetical protein
MKKHLPWVGPKSTIWTDSKAVRGGGRAKLIMWLVQSSIEPRLLEHRKLILAGKIQRFTNRWFLILLVNCRLTFHFH